jgi:DNA polymerase-4
VAAFAITLERIGRPELRDRPVVVAPLHSDRALILSASSEARIEGVFKGMALGAAMKFCPELIVLPPNPVLTEKGTGVLSKLAVQYTPVWEPVRPGHVYLDLTGTERLWGRAKDAADRIRREVKNRFSLPGTVGVAGNKMVAGIASRLVRSEGTLGVDHGRESHFMAPLRVDLLPGIGRIRRRMLLEELNITRVREVAALEVSNLRLVFGREAFIIHQRSLGIDTTPVHPPAREPVVSEAITLPRDENDDQRLLGIIRGLVEKCCLRLRKRHTLASWAGLLVRYADQIEVSRQARLSHPGFWEFELYPVLETLFLKACQRRTGVRFMKIWFRDLRPPDTQLSLFTETSGSRDKNIRLIQALDRVRERHGKMAVRYGRTA